MTTEQALQRGNNLVATAIVALSGIAFLPEFLLETEGPRKLDEVALFIIALVAIGWYMWGENRYSRSLVPVVLMVLALLVKVVGTVIELDDTADVGDDFGALILFALATIMIAWLYFRGTSVAAKSSQAIDGQPGGARG